jgi:hypothetical protein
VDGDNAETCRSEEIEYIDCGIAHLLVLPYIYIYIYICVCGVCVCVCVCAVLKLLATPSNFHIPLPSVVPFTHS